MITAQHRHIARDPDAAMLPLAMDSALIQFRQLVKARVQTEQEDLASGAWAGAP